MSNSKIHSFNVSLATEVGLAEAITLNHIHSLRTSREHTLQFTHEGRIWVYATRKSIMESLPYLSEQGVRTILNHLKEGGYILQGMNPHNAFDKSAYYTLTDKALELIQKYPTINELSKGGREL